MNRRLYAIHRWLSIVAVIQLLLWSISGLVFATIPKDDLHGRPVKAAHDGAFITLSSFSDDAHHQQGGEAEPNTLLTISDVIRSAEGLGVGSIRRIEIRGDNVAIISGTLRRTRIDLVTGRERLVDREEASEIARRDLPGRPTVVDVRRIDEASTTTTTSASPPIEYRGKATPAWQVIVADGHETAIYIDAISGDVTARRNNTWRAYDFLWSLHIMAYRDREEFRHPLLIGFAGLAVLTSLSGLTLWATRWRRAWRTRRSASAAKKASEPASVRLPR